MVFHGNLLWNQLPFKTQEKIDNVNIGNGSYQTWMIDVSAKYVTQD